MKLVPSNLGANKKNLTALGALLVILILVFIYNWSGSSSSPAPAAAPAPSAALPASPVPPRAPNNIVPVSLERTRRNSDRAEEFHPTLKLKDGTDVSKIDPTIRLELLAKLRAAEMKGGARSVFAFGAPPPPPVDPIQVAKVKEAEAQAKLVADKKHEEELKNKKPAGPPPPPPIPLKFFGYSIRGEVKRAFFLDGDDIDVAQENETIKNRYKVVHIGVNSVVVEDTQMKNQQTLPLVEELAG